MKSYIYLFLLSIITFNAFASTATISNFTNTQRRLWIVKDIPRVDTDVEFSGCIIGSKTKNPTEDEPCILRTNTSVIMRFTNGSRFDPTKACARGKLWIAFPVLYHGYYVRYSNEIGRGAVICDGAPEFLVSGSKSQRGWTYTVSSSSVTIRKTGSSDSYCSNILGCKFTLPIYHH